MALAIFGGKRIGVRPGDSTLGQRNDPKAVTDPGTKNVRNPTMSIDHVSDASFDSDVIKADLPVVVDFWAEWCGPCKMIAPALEEIAQDLDGKARIAKLNIDDNPSTPARYGVRGIPTLMIFKDGQVAATKVGALPKGALQQWIEDSI